jgi:uncharacterized membrane protein YphA (DoxX/SURF4 family)
MNIALWLVQLLLAAAFAVSGAMKIAMPIAALAQSAKWATDVPPALVRFIGACEIAGALGLVLPAVTRTKPRLAALAAGGLLTVMVLASIFHISRGELSALRVTLTLGALAAFVAWGRTSRVPVQAS